MTEYNLPHEKGRDKFKWYEGRNIEQMPRLINDNKIPMNVAQLMQRKLEVRNSDKEIKSAWIDNPFDLGDAVVYHPNGNMKIVLDSRDLRNISPNVTLNNGALRITPEHYNSLKGEEFKEGEFGKINEWLQKKILNLMAFGEF
jgi:hypothetical protein